MKKVCMRKLGLVLLVLLTMTWSLGCDLDSQVQRIVNDVRRDFDLPALAAGVINNDTYQGTAVAGITNVDNPRLVDIDDHFMIGSCTKSMTATVLAMLVKEELLTWDTVVWDIFPQYAGVENEVLDQAGDPKTAQDVFGDITVEQLLTHTAKFKHSPGLATAEAILDYEGAGATPTERRSYAMALLLKEAPQTGCTDDTYCYSNIGYIFAGVIAEEVAQTSYEDLLQQYVFEPAGMTTAGFGFPPGDEIPGADMYNYTQPWGHVGSNVIDINDIGYFAAWKDPVSRPAGGVKCTIGDFLKYVNWHLQGLLGNNALPKDFFEDIHSPIVEVLGDPDFGDGYYGLGWRLIEHPDPDVAAEVGPMYAHGGNVSGFNALMVFSPLKETAIVAITNKNNSFDALMMVAERINQLQ